MIDRIVVTKTVYQCGMEVFGLPSWIQKIVEQMKNEFIVNFISVIAHNIMLVTQAICGYT